MSALGIHAQDDARRWVARSLPPDHRFQFRDDRHVVPGARAQPAEQVARFREGVPNRLPGVVQQRDGGRGLPVRLEGEIEKVTSGNESLHEAVMQPSGQLGPVGLVGEEELTGTGPRGLGGAGAANGHRQQVREQRQRRRAGGPGRVLGRGGRQFQDCDEAVALAQRHPQHVVSGVGRPVGPCGITDDGVSVVAFPPASGPIRGLPNGGRTPGRLGQHAQRLRHRGRTGLGQAPGDRGAGGQTSPVAWASAGSQAPPPRRALSACIGRRSIGTTGFLIGPWVIKRAGPQYPDG